VGLQLREDSADDVSAVHRGTAAPGRRVARPVLLDKSLGWAFSEGAGHNSWLGRVPPPTDR